MIISTRFFFFSQHVTIELFVYFSDYTIGENKHIKI